MRLPHTSFPTYLSIPNKKAKLHWTTMYFSCWSGNLFLKRVMLQFLFLNIVQMSQIMRDWYASDFPYANKYLRADNWI